MTLDPLQILTSLVVFAAVFMLIWSLFRYPVSPEVPVHRRFASALGVDQRGELFVNPVTAPLYSLALAIARRFDFPAIRSGVKQNLDASDNPNGYDVDEYLAICLVSSAAAALLTAMIGMALTARLMPMLTLAMAMAGLVAPYWHLRSTARARLQRISKKLPYTLDLIALMMGAGSTFTEAIETTVRDEPDDDFNQELRIVQAEIDFGAKRATALANMAGRVPIESLRSIVGAVNQAEQLGTPLSAILSAQAGMLRLHRSIHAEKLAASAGLRILVPTMLMLIAAIIILFGPIAISWYRGELGFGM